MRYFFAIFFLITSVSAQIQEKQVFGFQGGLVNSVANSLMKDNMALVLENYDITDIGVLKRRPGMENHYGKDSAAAKEAIFTRQVDDGKEMLIIRLDSTHFKGAGGSLSDTISNNVFVMAKCSPVNEDCSTFVSVGYYSHRRGRDRPFSASSTTWINNLFIATQKSELVFWDGNNLWPSRPLAPGQPQVFAIDGGGNVNGRYTYKIAYAGTGAISAGTDTSLFSPPSWQVDVSNGKVAIILPLPLVATGLALIYRKHVDSSLYGFVATHNISSGDSLLYLDNIASTSVNGSYQFGPRQSENGVWRHGAYDSLETELKPVAPGGFNIAVSVKTSSNQSIAAPITLDSLSRATVYYQVVYKDSSGREAYGTPICAFSWDSTGASPNYIAEQFVHMSLTNIPVGDSNITSKELRRRVAGVIFKASVYTSAETDSIFGGGWRVIAALNKDSTTYTDSVKLNNQDGTGIEPGDTVFTLSLDSAYSLGPESMSYDDSNINFQPTDIVMFGSRAWTIGNPQYKNRLYYSQFGRPTTWASDNFHNLFSDQGDWAVGLASLGQRLLVFRQNSVMQLTGLTFYQFNIQEVISGAGLTGRRTLQIGLNDVFFAHTTGLYQFSRFSGIRKSPVSLPIQNTVDSIKSRIQRSVGNLVEDEYWWSVANPDTLKNTETYIWAQVPIPHWKSYSFAVESMVTYDFDTLATDFKTDRWIMLRENDSLYRWGYDDTATTDAGVTFTATYQSKYFFEGGGREKVRYVDLFGSGSATNMTLVFYRNYGEGIAGTPFDSVTFSPNFDDGTRDRVKIDAICENFSLRIHDNGTGGYQLRGFTLGWQPWDKGKL